MSKNIESLWPSLTEIKLPGEVPPIQILQEQASAIGDETHNIIEGQVLVEKTYYNTFENKKGLESIWSPKDIQPFLIRNDERLLENNDYIRHSLFVRSPIISGYKYRILLITHKITEIYPVRIQSEIDEIKISDKIISSPNELREVIREILHSEPVRNVLSSLLAQSGYRQAA
nr:hypothetical protein [Armatimonas sp.]